jgi:hypothetical protein
MASILPGTAGKKPAKGRGHGGNAHYAVNLDTGHHVPTINSSPVKTTPAEKPLIGPDTLIFASKMGHAPMPYMDHAMQGTNVDKHLNKHAKYKHPHEHMKQAAREVSALPGRAA